MLGATILKTTTGYKITGKTDSGRSVEINYLDVLTAITEMAQKIDAMENKDLEEAKRKAEEALQQNKEVLKELEKTEAEKEALREKYETIKAYFKPWKSGENLVAGETVNHEGLIYTVLKDHRTSGTGTPDYTSDLYKPVQPVPGAAASPEDVIAGE